MRDGGVHAAPQHFDVVHSRIIGRQVHQHETPVTLVQDRVNVGTKMGAPMIEDQLDRACWMLRHALAEHVGNVSAAFLQLCRHYGVPRVVIHGTNAIGTLFLARSRNHDLLPTPRPQFAESREQTEVDLGAIIQMSLGPKRGAEGVVSVFLIT